jgi:hypothetical protein
MKIRFGSGGGIQAVRSLSVQTVAPPTDTVSSSTAVCLSSSCWRRRRRCLGHKESHDAKPAILRSARHPVGTLFFEASALTLPMRCFTIERFGIKTLWSKQMSSQRTPLSSAAQGAAICRHQDPNSLFFRAPPKMRPSSDCCEEPQRLFSLYHCWLGLAAIAGRYTVSWPYSSPGS